VRELIARMAGNPSATGYLLAASLMANLLGLASSLYVILVLNRYVSYGVTATLTTLTLGVGIAVVAEAVFRRLRLRLAAEIVGDADDRLSTGVYGLLLTARIPALERRPPGERAELLRGVERAENALGSPNLAALADVPFSLLFLVALLLLSPPLAIIATAFCLISLALAWTGHRRLVRPVRTLSGWNEQIAALIGATAIAADTIRQFGGAPLLMARWRAVNAQARTIRGAVTLGQADGAVTGQAMQALMAVAVICVGAMLVVGGRLDVGALIGANLIAARALAPLTRLIPLGEALKAAEQGLAGARRFAETAGEPEGRKELPDWRGRLELRDLGLAFPGAAALFSQVGVTLEPGGVLVITGRNGTGKSSLLRLIAGLIEPTSGQILVDGVDLRQIAPAWWRRQVSYQPQEPVFLEASLRDNLLAARPGASEADMARCLIAAGLRSFIDRHPAGLDQVLTAGGATLAPGLRRRLGLARALLIDGPLMMLDEPSEGLDREGADGVYALLLEMARRGRTLIVVTHDPVILRGARLVLRFYGDEPELVTSPPPAPTGGTP
jgi:ATP-binding cassette subfamily C protein LapB